MSDFIQKIIDKWNYVDLNQGIIDTLYMTIISTVIAFAIGLLIGLLLIMTDENGILKNKTINRITGVIVNVGRSIPFIILMVFLIPFTRMIVGKSWGSTAAIIPLTIGAIPFVARLAETSFKEVDKGVIESAICMGATPFDIAFHVYLKEAIPSLIRNASVTMITLIGYTAIAGSIGAGGIGKIAINYGYNMRDTFTMNIAIVVIIIMVQLIQVIFDFIAKKINKV